MHNSSLRGIKIRHIFLTNSIKYTTLVKTNEYNFAADIDTIIS